MVNPSAKNAEFLEKAAELISQADGLIIAAGAGMGVDSGLPDFRGNEGFWRAYPALAMQRMRFVEIANPAAFHGDPRIAWGFYGHRLNLYRRTVPHEGFIILKRWADAMPKGYSIYTSNVDGQFQKAGFSANHIHECHGSIHWLQCLHKCTHHLWPADDLVPVVDEAKCKLVSDIPRCPHCGQTARPNILMFDDWLWQDGRSNMQEAQQNNWLEAVKNPVVVELGAGSSIPSVRMFSTRATNRHNAHLIRINPGHEDHKVPRFQDVGLRMGALDALQEISKHLGR